MASPTPSSARPFPLAVAVAAGAFAAGALCAVGLHGWVRRRHPGAFCDAPLPPTPVSAAELLEHVRALRAADEALRRQRGVEEVAVTLRAPTAADVAFLAQQWQDSYNSSAAQLHEAPVFPTLDGARAMVAHYVASTAGLLAVRSSAAKGASAGSEEQDGGEEILASAVNDEADIAELGGVVGCGPWTVGWGTVAHGVGRTLLSAAVEASLSRGAQSLRLLQGLTNHASFALYSKLGFAIREPLGFLAGTLREEEVSRVLALHPRWELRELSGSAESAADVAACVALWQRTTGSSRRRTIERVAADGTRRAKKFGLFDEKGTCIAFSSGFGSMTSSCASSLAAFMHLLCAAQTAHASAIDERFRSVTPALHVCIRSQPELARWALANGLRILRNSNLMVLGGWTPPQTGFVYCPSTELN